MQTPPELLSLLSLGTWLTTVTLGSCPREKQILRPRGRRATWGLSQVPFPRPSRGEAC